MNAFPDILTSIGKAIPVHTAARLALLGVITLGVSGFAYYSRAQVVEVKLISRVETVERNHAELDTHVRQHQAELKADLEKRFDRIEDKLDKLMSRGR